jgi:hypothetical protein
MICNVGGVDRLARAVLGAVLLSLVFVGPQSLWGLIGVIPLATALLGWCPLYVPLGLNTCRPQPTELRRGP